MSNILEFGMKTIFKVNHQDKVVTVCGWHREPHHRVLSARAKTKYPTYAVSHGICEDCKRLILEEGT